MTTTAPKQWVARGKYILGELDGWSIDQKIEFLLYLLEYLRIMKQRGYQ